MKKAGHTHAGQCTEGTLFQRASAEQELLKKGFTWNAHSYEWERDGISGRLEFIPDYCNDSPVTGTAFYVRTHTNQLVEILGTLPENFS